MSNLTVKEIRTSTCETIYMVGDRELVLWIITGGTPALDFAMTPFAKRFPVVEKWNDNNWNGTCYLHQLGQIYPIGPKIEDVLPRGFDDFWNFYNENISKIILCEKRFGAVRDYLPITSKRVHDKIDRTYVHAHVGSGYHCSYPPVVTCRSRLYSGRFYEKMSIFGSWWQKCQKLLDKYLNKRWDELSEDEFQEIVALLKEYKS